MRRKPGALFSIAALALFGGGSVFSDTAMAQTTQIWEDRYPASGGTGLFDEAVGAVQSLDAIYVVGTKSLSSTNSVVVLRKMDFDGNLLEERHGTNILTQLYHQVSGAGQPLWNVGAVWNNSTVNGNDRGGAVTVTALDTPVGDRNARALVGGTTTDGNGNERFVTLKYDLVGQTSGNKEPLWDSIEDDVASVYGNVARGIAHVMRGSGVGRKLWFFMTGSSDAGSSAEDIWTVGTREDNE